MNFDNTHPHTGPMWSRHFSNVLNPVNDPAYQKYCGETFEPLTDLPYTIESTTPTSIGNPYTSPSKHSKVARQMIPSLTPTPERYHRSLLYHSPLQSMSPKLPLVLPPYPSSPDKENREELEDIREEERTGSRKKGVRVFGGKQLIGLARAMVDSKPFLQPHGMKGKTWQAIRDDLVAERLIRNNVPVQTVQHKGEHLVAYWKDKNSTTDGVKAIAKALTSLDLTTIAALMDSVEAQYDQAKNQSDETKAKLKQKQDDDTAGGEAIRNASMRTLRKRKAAQVDTDNSNDEDEASSKSSSISSAGDAKGRKRQRKDVRRSKDSSSSNILLFMQKDAEDRKVQHGEVTTLLQNADKRGERMTDIMMGFLELDKAHFEAERK